jgi:hypothetical protein
MGREPLIRLTWHGLETLEAVPKLLNQTEQIEIELPNDYNHALFSTLHPEASTAELEDIDISGGPELLAEIATIKGLEGFAALIDVLKSVQATIQITSPPKLLIIVPSLEPISE